MSLSHLLSRFCLPASLFFAIPTLQAADPNQWFNSQFVLQNTGNLPAEEVYVTFYGAIVDSTGQGGSAQTYGSNTFQYSESPANADYIYQSYTLDNFLVNNFNYGNNTASGPSGIGSAYVFSLNNLNSGRIYISNKAFTAAPTPNDSYGLVEIHAIGAQPAAGDQVYNNWDISYVDGASMPLQIQLRNTDGSSYSAATLNPVSTKPAILNQLKATMPSSAISTDGQRVNSPGQATSLANGPTTATQYHDWSQLMDTMISTGATIQVQNFTVPSNSPTFNSNAYGLSDALFGYAGGGQTYPDQNLTDGLAGQNYDFTTSFVSNLYSSATAQQQAILDLNPTWGITSGGPAVKGAMLTGTGGNPGTSVTPAFTIYVTYDTMNNPSGIYGSNPSYIVIANDGSFAFKTAGIQNDVTGRVVGDLMASMVFGMAQSDKKVLDVFHAAGFVDSANLLAGLATAGLNITPDTKFSDLTTGQYFALMSFGAANGLTSTTDPADAPVLAWIGAGIQSNSSYYDEFANAIAGLSFAYGTAFGDRFEGLYSPDTTWYNFPGVEGENMAQNPVTGENFEELGYGVITFNASVVPEPSTWALMAFGGFALGFAAWRRRIAANR